MNQKVLIKGYQPDVKLQEGYQPLASVQTNKKQHAELNVKPPKGGTGEVTIKK